MAIFDLYKRLTKYILTEQQLADNGYPFPKPNEEGTAIVKTVSPYKKISPTNTDRHCARCSVLYCVDELGEPVESPSCSYHMSNFARSIMKYLCCGQELQSKGCCQATTHVSDNYNPDKLYGYVQTRPIYAEDSFHGVYALDCEMSYTTAGLELTRVTIIGENGEIVFDCMVKPQNPITDYNTRFSGITESDLENEHTTLKDIQEFLLQRISDKTILVGHGLENDLHALKLIHKNVVDTSIVFTNNMAPSRKPALRYLTKYYLKRTIQNQSTGHNSAEDGIACFDLMYWKLEQDELSCETTDVFNCNPSSPTVTPQPVTQITVDMATFFYSPTTPTVTSQPVTQTTMDVATSSSSPTPPIVTTQNFSKLQENTTCWHFLQGYCWFGKSCRYKHSLEDETTIPARLKHLSAYERHIMNQLLKNMEISNNYNHHTKKEELANYLVVPA
ncbi:hypothetical protein Pmani_006398 [Petrolisthes manimaculis]|uniref:C3H1-type domain-containing protein n=1 Tax=Petrolisthes manimaculis TaxID=1843537 RepID=A0AAE1QAF1_9EUCA|nr:hypothetical protein Pmani_006398 [Petrolisthes manimaculis]